MAYNGSIVYVDNTVTPPNGVSVHDVQQALGVSAQDVGSLCRSIVINKWAKYKPIRMAGVVIPITDTQRKAANYGFSVSEVTGAPDTIALMTAESSAWVYNRPTSGYPYRLTDFNQYYKFAKCPIQLSQSFSILAQEGLPQAAAIAIDGDVVGLDTQYNVLVGDIFDLTRYGSYRLTLAVVDNTVSPARVLCYYCSPYTLNDPNAMAGEEKIVTVRSMPSAASPTLGRTYTAVLMMSNYTPQTEAECKDGILPSAMTGVTAVSLNLDNGNDRFTFTYQQGGIDPEHGWAFRYDELSIGSAGVITTEGFPQNVEVYLINGLYVEIDSPSSASSELHSMQIKAVVSISGTHYMWDSMSAGPDDVSSWQLRSSGVYDVTDWVDMWDYAPVAGGTTLVDLTNRNKYHLTGYDNQYPILLVDTDYPTDITVQVWYRIGASGAGTWALGDGGTIEHLDDYILIEN